MPNHRHDATYLGDGVYARQIGVTVVLTTGSHIEAEAEHVITLEHEVLLQLKRWLTDRGLPQDEPITRR